MGEVKVRYWNGYRDNDGSFVGGLEDVKLKDIEYQFDVIIIVGHLEYAPFGFLRLGGVGNLIGTLRAPIKPRAIVFPSIGPAFSAITIARNFADSSKFIAEIRKIADTENRETIYFLKSYQGVKATISVGFNTETTETVSVGEQGVETLSRRTTGTEVFYRMFDTHFEDFNTLNGPLNREEVQLLNLQGYGRYRVAINETDVKIFGSLSVRFFSSKTVEQAYSYLFRDNTEIYSGATNSEGRFEISRLLRHINRNKRGVNNIIFYVPSNVKDVPTYIPGIANISGGRSTGINIEIPSGLFPRFRNFGGFKTSFKRKDEDLPSFLQEEGVIATEDSNDGFFIIQNNGTNPWEFDKFVREVAFASNYAIRRVSDNKVVVRGRDFFTR